MGAADNVDLGTFRRPSRGPKWIRKGKILSHRVRAKGFAGSPKTFGKPAHGECAKTGQIEITSIGSSVMLQFIDRHPAASLWLIAVGQGAAMLGLNVLLRYLVA